MDFSFGFGNPIGNLSDIYGTGDRAMRHRTEYQREQIGPDMLAKVEAAKAAGIHPNVVIGGGMSSSPIVDGGSSGSGIVGRTGARDDPDVKRYNKARADLAELDVQAAQRRLSSQPGNLPSRDFVSSGADSVISPVQAPGPYQFRPDSESRIPGYSDVGKIKPSESMSRSSAFPFMTATGDPAMREYTVPVGGNPTRIMLPYSEEGVSETLENIPWWMWPQIYRENAKHYGRDWSDSLWDALGLPRTTRRYRSDSTGRHSVFDAPSVKPRQFVPFGFR